MLPHHFHGGVDFRSRKTQPFHDLLRHFRADAIVPVKSNAAGFIHGRSRRFRHVVKQDGKNERKGDLRSVAAPT